MASNGSCAPAAVLRVPQQQLGAWLQPAPGHQLPDHLYLGFNEDEKHRRVFDAGAQEPFDAMSTSNSGSK